MTGYNQRETYITSLPIQYDLSSETFIWCGSKPSDKSEFWNFKLTTYRPEWHSTERLRQSMKIGEGVEHASIGRRRHTVRSLGKSKTGFGFPQRATSDLKTVGHLGKRQTELYFIHFPVIPISLIFTLGTAFVFFLFLFFLFN